MEDRYMCPACEAEGRAEPQPESAFYTWVGSNGYKRRSKLCRRHTVRAVVERQADRVNPKSPHYDKAFHEKIKARRRLYARRKLNPESPEYNSEMHERRLANKRRSYSKRKAEGK